MTSHISVHYIITTLLPSLPSLPPAPASCSHQGLFLVGGDEADSVLPQVHLGGSRPRHLVVFHAINSTLCLLLPDQPQADFFPKYSAYMGPLLSDLSADLTHLWANNTSATGSVTGSESVRFVYFNAANFAVKSTMEPGSEALLSLATELSSDLPESGGEVTGKLSSDKWMVVRVAGLRTVIIILSLKNLNLLEVSEEVAKLDKSSFAKICLL